MKFSDLLNRPQPPSGWESRGTIWPSGDFSLGYARVFPEGYDPSAEYLPDLPDNSQSGAEQEGAQPLNLTSAPNSHTRPARGGKGLTGYGKKMLKSAAVIAEQRFYRQSFTFQTITLPPVSQPARREIVRVWPEFINRLQQFIGRKQEAAGLPRWQFSCTEVQTRRLERTGEAYLHLHCAYPNWSGRTGEWLLTPNRVRDWCEEFWSTRVPEVAEGHINVNMVKIRKSVARYLAKYVSKGAGESAALIADWGEGVHPHTWWNVTKPLKTAVLEARPKSAAAGRWLETVINLALEGRLREPLGYLHACELEWEGFKLNVGWIGALGPDIMSSILGMIESSRCGTI